MKYLFLYHSPNVLGGTETLVGRMAQWLINQGHQVTLITTDTEKWSHVVPTGVSVFCLKKRYRDLFYPFLCAKLWKSLNVSEPDVIKTFDMPSSWVGCLIAGLLKRQVKFVSGIYGPHIFNHRRVGHELMDGWPLYLGNFLKNIPNSARLFCDTQEIQELKLVHGSEQGGQFWPLPVDGSRFAAIRRDRKRGKIVSIGRLAPAKEYNLYMVQVIANLRAKGYDVSWTVYGTGEYENEVRTRAKQHGVVEHVKLCGDVEYSRLGTALEDADVFVGMGTAILEASFCRVPNVLAIAYDVTGITYGPIHKMPFGAIGQCLNDVAPDLLVEDQIARILDMPAAEYEQESQRVFNYANQYSIGSVMKRFENLVAQAEPIKVDRLLHMRNFLYAAGRAIGVRLDEWELKRVSPPLESIEVS